MVKNRHQECDRFWEVDAGREGRLSDIDVAAHERHRAGCAACRERFAENEQLAELGRAFRWTKMDPLRARRLRAKIMRAAAQPTSAGGGHSWLLRPRVLMVMSAVTAAICMALFVVGQVRKPPPISEVTAVTTPPPALAATITAQPNTQWTRQRHGGVERVRLMTGTITVDVRKQLPNEQFFVDLPDGEIEVRGTRFDVTVEDAATVSVRVEHGVVAFRRANASEVILHDSDSWEMPPTTPILTMAASALPAPSAPNASLASATPNNSHVATAATATAARTTTTTSVNTAAEYDAAMNAYRAKDWPDAADRFATFVVAHPHAAETEDASFLEASALAHEGRSDAAAAVASRFLVRYPASFHAKDAAVLVARAARDR